MNKKRGGLSANRQVLHLIAPPPYTKGFTTPFFRFFYFRLTYSKSQPSDSGRFFKKHRQDGLVKSQNWDGKVSVRWIGYRQLAYSLQSTVYSLNKRMQRNAVDGLFTKPSNKKGEDMSDYNEMWKGLGLDMVRHDQLLRVIGKMNLSSLK